MWETEKSAGGHRRRLSAQPHPPSSRGEPPDDWFPEGSEWERRAPTQRAKAVCARCPVPQECLDYAMANHLVGIWGGRDDKERRRLQRLARQVK